MLRRNAGAGVGASGRRFILRNLQMKKCNEKDLSPLDSLILNLLSPIFTACNFNRNLPRAERNEDDMNSIIPGKNTHYGYLIFNIVIFESLLHFFSYKAEGESKGLH